jgi:hypothetical protein
MRTLLILIVSMFVGAEAWAGSVGDAVEVRVISEMGFDIPLYPAGPGSTGSRVYAEAVKGDNYTISVRNRLGRRVGVVIAVDGRNIISGKKSWLKNKERMYILDPYEEEEFKGWRTGSDRINRFYFTSAADSYAAAFKDESAMGVIAVAVYPEIRHYEDHDMEISAARPAGPLSKDGGNGPAAHREKSDSAGTGYGREEYSPVRVVEFEPERTAREKIFIKYEWRETLCRMGIVACHRPWPRPYNRMWDDEGYAPPPPGWN